MSLVVGMLLSMAACAGDTSSSERRGSRSGGSATGEGAGDASGSGAGEAKAGAGGDLATAGGGGASGAGDGATGSAGSGTHEERCGNDEDEDGDGSADEGCVCDEGGGATRDCYAGPAGTEGVGLCAPGKQECLHRTEFDVWGTCEHARYPDDEACDDEKDNDCDGMVDEGCEEPPPDPPPPPPGPPPVVPVVCSVANMTHVVGAADCAPNQAVFMMDDGGGPNFICCPLPADDILVPPAASRSGQCGANEVITGATAANVFNCTPINTMRYQLAAPAKSCYFGSGAAGGGGVANCAGHPASFSVLANNYFGSDGCSSQPYGALFVKQTSKYCKDQMAAELQYTGTVAGDPAAGTPVDTFME